MLISVYHVEPDFFDDWSPIHLIVRLLINWIDIYIVKWNTVLSHIWKLCQMALMKEKKYWTYITKHLQA